MHTHAVAMDANDVAASSAAVPVTVNEPPGVVITRPANWAISSAPVSIPIQITATDSDPNGVWSLDIVGDAPRDQGALGGCHLHLIIGQPVNPVPALLLNAAVSPDGRRRCAIRVRAGA